MALQDYVEDARQYRAIKDQEKLLADRKKLLRDKLVAVLQAEGTEDDSGHLRLELNDDLKLTYQRKESKSIKLEEAEEMLKAKGIWEDCVEYVPVIKDDAIMAAHYKGQITEEEIDSLVDTKVTYAFIL